VEGTLKTPKFVLYLGLDMEDEVIIIEVKPEMLDITNEPGKFSCKLNHLKKIYKVNQPITRRPEYLAIRDPNDCLIRLLFKIDQDKSKFEKGQIVPQGEPIKVNIYLRLKDKRPNHTVWYTPMGVKEKGLVLRVIWYTSFKTMLTLIQWMILLKKNLNHFQALQLDLKTIRFCVMAFPVYILATANSSTSQWTL
jgi:hypothetical protein